MYVNNLATASIVTTVDGIQTHSWVSVNPANILYLYCTDKGLKLHIKLVDDKEICMFLDEQLLNDKRLVETSQKYLSDTMDYLNRQLDRANLLKALNVDITDDAFALLVDAISSLRIPLQQK